MAEVESTIPLVRLAELCSKIGSGATPRGGSTVYQDSGIAFIRSQNVHDNRFDDTGLVRIGENAADQLKGVEVRPGDVLLNITGDSVLRCCLVPDEFLPARVSQHVAILRSNGSVVPRFLQSFLVAPGVRAELLTIASGDATRKALTKAQIEAIEIPLPSLRRQHAIAEVLGALDDKIAANTRLAATVDEYLANRLEALLKQWDGESVSLSDVALVNPEKRSPVVEGQLRYIDIASVGVGSMEWPELQPWESAPSRARRGVAVGDVIWSTVRPNRRSHALILDEDPDLVASTGLAVIRASGVPWGYLYEALRRSSFTEHLEGAAEGSAYPAVKPEAFARASIPIPKDTEVRSFGAEAQALREHIGSLARESRTLRDLRDALLPQLMSGKLRVREAAEMAGL